MRAPVTSTKHYIQVSLATVTGGANLVTGIAQGVELGNVSAGVPVEVRAGSVIKAVFIEMWMRSSSATPSTGLMTLFKVSQNGTMTFAEQIALHSYDNKKNVLYHTQGLINDNDADAIPFVRQWFKIPKGKQRMGLGDKISFSIAAQAPVDCQICGFMTYKEYY